MKKLSKMGGILLVIVIIISQFAAQIDYSKYGGGALGFSPHYVLYFILYVGEYLYAVAILALAYSIYKSLKNVDKAERTRLVIAKGAALILLLIPIIYYLLTAK